MVKSLPILLVLLLSLCVSRGEGVHLFPFDDCGPASASAAGTAELAYNFSIINQGSSPVLKKQDLPPCDAECAAPKSDEHHRVVSAANVVVAAAACVPAVKCSKSLHSSASDRSPPFFA
jgi:hypothetical protein